MKQLSSIGLAFVMVLGIESCQGVTQNVETLRAEKIEIVDGQGAVKMDVASKLRTLEERVQKLEAALEKQQQAEAKAAAEKPQPPPPTPVAASATAGASIATSSSSSKSKPPAPAGSRMDIY